MSVFANGLGVSGKATDNKTLAAMPDVCMSPPPPPAGPVPIPYPNFGMASDTTDGCTTVFIKGKEAGKKNASKYSKITGNEAATNSFGAGVVSHKITGALKFAAYSFDVMFEGGGAERFTDLTTTNHMNTPNGAQNASLAPPSPPDPPTEADCAAMKSELGDDTGAVIDAAEAKQPGFTSKALDQLNDSATAATATMKPGGRGYGTSNQLYADRLNRVSGNKGYDTPTQPGYKAYEKTKSNVECEGTNGKLEHNTGRDSRHAEMNILNKIFAGYGPRPASVTFSISYPSVQGQYEPNMPCPACAEFIRKACVCIEIYVCDPETNEPKSQCPPK